MNSFATHPPIVENTGSNFFTMENLGMFMTIFGVVVFVVIVILYFKNKIR